MKRPLFLINLAWLISIIFIAAVGIKFNNNRGNEIRILRDGLEKSEKELGRVEDKIRDTVFKNSSFVEQNKVLVQELSGIRKEMTKAEKEKQSLGIQIEALREENNSLKAESMNISKSREEQRDVEKESFKKKLEVAKEVYTDKMGDVTQKMEGLSNKLNSLNERRDLLEKVVTQTMADAGKERVKFYHYQLGLSYEQNNRFEDAIEQYKKVLKLDPNNADTYLQLAGIYSYQIEDIDKAEFYAKRYAKLKYIELTMPYSLEDFREEDTDLPAPFLKAKLAEISFAKVNLEGRISDMKKALKKNQKLTNRLKKIAQKKDVIEGQLQHMEASLKNEALKFHYNLGLSYDHSRDYKKACKEYMEALKIAPDDADSHYNLAVVYDDHLKDKKKAIEHYERYLKLRPASRDAEKIEYWIVRAKKDIESHGKLFFPRK